MTGGAAALEREQRLLQPAERLLLGDIEQPVEHRDEAGALALHGHESLLADGEADPAVTELNQVRDGELHRLLVVVGDERRDELRGEAVDEDDWRLRSSSFW